MPRTKFGSYSKKLREKSGLSQAEVAKKLGMSSGQMVSNWERGACFPPLRDLKRLANMYDVPLKSFFDRFSEAYKNVLWENVRGK